MEEETSSSQHQNHWIQIQDELRKKLVTEDDFPWQLPSSSSSSFVNLEQKKEVLKYIGGVDISFSKEDPSIACGTLVVLELDSLNVVYDDYTVVKLQIPYIPGFLAFREAPLLLKLLEKMKNSAHPFYPQLLMVDGNGLLHPRGRYSHLTREHACGFGLACHLGVIADMPTIGMGKNLHHVEGLNHSEVRDLLEANNGEQSVYLNGNSGRTLGVAIRSTVGALKPIYISIGHRISLSSAMNIVKLTCKYRVPEPVRQADLRSREYLRKHSFGQQMV